MKCEGCGAELAEGAKSCSACGRAVGSVQRAGAETAYVAKETGEALGKAGRGLVGGIKGFGQSVKKGAKGSDDPPQEPTNS